jgi:hypothetical protein
MKLKRSCGGGEWAGKKKRKSRKTVDSAPGAYFMYSKRMLKAGLKHQYSSRRQFCSSAVSNVPFGCLLCDYPQFQAISTAYSFCSIRTVQLFDGYLVWSPLASYAFVYGPTACFPTTMHLDCTSTCIFHNML